MTATDSPAPAADAGAIYVWVYEEPNRSYAGWHLTADGAGCQALLTTIDRLIVGDAATLTTRPPTPAILSVPNKRRAPMRAVSSLQLRLAADPRAWQLAESDGALTLLVGSERLAAVRAGVVDVRRGRGDYSITATGPRPPRDQRLWFWWMPRMSDRR